MNIKQCPSCEKFNVKHSIIKPDIKQTIKVPAYCLDCKSRWYIVFEPTHSYGYDLEIDGENK